MSRKLAREISFKLVFEYEFLNKKNPLTLEDFLVLDKVSEADSEYIKANYEGILNNYEEITNIIKENLKDYTVKRVFKIDFAILILAVYEIKYTDILAKVAINEAVELSKKFSTEKSYSFINGVLAKIVKGENNE